MEAEDAQQLSAHVKEKSSTETIKMRGQWETIRCPITKKNYWIFVDRTSSWGYNLRFAETLTRRWVAEQGEDVKRAFAEWRDRSQPCDKVVPAEHIQRWKLDPNNFTFQDDEEEAARQMKCIAGLMAGSYIPRPDKGAEEAAGEAGAVANNNNKVLTAEVGTQTEGMSVEALKGAMASLQAEIEKLEIRPVADPVEKPGTSSMSTSSDGGAVRRYVQLTDMRAVPPPASYDPVNPRTARLMGYERKPAVEPKPDQAEPIAAKTEPVSETRPTQQELRASETEPTVGDGQPQQEPSASVAAPVAEDGQVEREPAVMPEPVRLNWWKSCHNCHQRTHLRRECPNPNNRVCFWCWSITDGHVADDCPHNGQGRPSYWNRVAELDRAVRILQNRIEAGIADESDLLAAKKLDPSYHE